MMPNIHRPRGDLRLLAFYLPQFHPIPENDAWWGAGFTEWTTVVQAKPWFRSHYQPHLPADLGFYDLRVPETREAQAELAREYGVDGFVYYHYWFHGRRILERPFAEVLRAGRPDFPFCLCWANENWTRRWDGEEQEVLLKMHYSRADDCQHIRSLFSAFEDKRYVRVDGKPVFLVYRVEWIPEPRATTDVWREEARRAGIGDLFLLRVESLQSSGTDPGSLGFDGAVEFAPDWQRRGPLRGRDHALLGPLVRRGVLTNYRFANYISTYDALVADMLAKPVPGYRWFRGVTPSWDNSPRRRSGANIFTGSTPATYQRWLERVLQDTRMRHQADSQLVFVNAWNEWGEGCHLEPDARFGRAYLEATRRARATGDQNFGPGPLAMSHPSGGLGEWPR
jgi:lipopolysaccharide biosynthesis protein